MNKLILKYTFDKIIAAAIIIILSPLFLLIILINWAGGIFDKTTRGPVLYREKRISRGEEFILYKFRTLRMSVIKNMSPDNSATFLQNDPKNTTPLGKILIKFYMDELPQLFQVLFGKMSLVGPRPKIKRVYEEDLKNGYTALKNLRAGIAGLDQLSKGEVDAGVAQSEEYFEKSTQRGMFGLLVYDINIMLKTFLKSLKGEGL